LTKQLKFSILLLLIISLVTPAFTAAPDSIPVTPGGDGELLISRPAGDSLSLTAFASILPQDGSASIPVGVYVKDILAFQIFAQPTSNPGYVTSQPGAVSLFGLATQSGTTGLIAHSYLAGQSFFDLSQGQHVVVVMADGSRLHYRVSSVRRLQALSPWSPLSNFVDLDIEGEILSASQVFNQVYQGSNQVVFQTCIELEDNPVWGRLFVTAEPINPYPYWSGW